MSKRYNIKPRIIVYSLITIILLLNMVTNIIVLVTEMMFLIIIPLYHTFKALENKEFKDDKRWLCYWFIFGIFKIIEFVFSKILFFCLFKFFFSFLCFYIYSY